MKSASLFRFPMRSPSDVTALETLIQSGELDPKQVIAVIAKTEGNGSPTDYSVALAERALTQSLCKAASISVGEFETRVALFVEGGAEGVISPHGVVFAVTDDEVGRTNGPRLAIGTATGGDLDPSNIGRIEQADQVATLVKDAMASADLSSRDTLASVIALVPTLGLEQIQRIEAEEQQLVASFPESIAAASRRAATAGVALATEQIGRDEATRKLYPDGKDAISNKALVMAQESAARTQVLVMGTSTAWTGSLSVSHAVMQDALDLTAVRQALNRLGLPSERPLTPEEADRVVACFAKAEADPTSQVRGRRHVMLEDADIHHTRHIRSVVGTVLAGAIGHPQVFISAGAEGQGPDGGGPLCLIGVTDADPEGK